ncbi:hypothetical protein T265_01231 [Opisthorchis viverrini]|uniref:Uncharacterized protein n=1 Tax=Opisthorchis viverrini TaxID=6198 RepID=A0A075AJ45_OPIVI|nr:hypothetical protein T265_01231 [Opisthorchis viverrini]KER32744.1 hypothetical protein T265_01231 [Opisthorchis viverrini]
MHILQSCWITHDAGCALHNRVARKLAKRLRQLGYTVFEELRAPTSTSFIKPYLVAVRDHRATVIDISIGSDGPGVTVWNEKKQKYGADEYSSSVLRVIGCDFDFLVHQPMIISYRGICFPQYAKAVLGLGLLNITVSVLCLLATVGSPQTAVLTVVTRFLDQVEGADVGRNLDEVSGHGRKGNIKLVKSHELISGRDQRKGISTTNEENAKS